LTDVEISGEGRIDGAGSIWWKGSTERSTRVTKLPYPPRPYLVAFNGCRRVRLRGIALSNSPKVHLITRSCEDVTIDGLTITAPSDAPNTAAILATSTRRLTIRHCVIDVDDDHVALNASHAWSTDDVTIADCRFGRGHGVSIGSDITSGVRNVVVKNCTFEGSRIGLRIKAPPEGAGLVENITYQDISMRNVGLPFTINLQYAERPVVNPLSPAAALPVVRQVEFTRITVEGAKRAGEFIGLHYPRVGL
jgi:polygalacturonase